MSLTCYTISTIPTKPYFQRTSLTGYVISPTPRIHAVSIGLKCESAPALYSRAVLRVPSGPRIHSWSSVEEQWGLGHFNILWDPGLRRGHLFPRQYRAWETNLNGDTCTGQATLTQNQTGALGFP